MQKILIRNFGPLENIEIEVKDILLFIGPQASGKSTISKSIYFFKSLKDDLIRYIIELIEKKDFKKPLGSFAKKIRAKFLDFWGPTFHFGNMYLKYDFGKNISISISLKGRYVNPNFSNLFKEKFLELIERATVFANQMGKRDSKFLSSSDILSLESEKRAFLSNIQQLISDIFFDDRDLVFIPAGRSLLATLSDQLQYIHPHRIDYLMRAFIERINNSKAIFSKDLNELIIEKKKLTQEKIDFPTLSIAKEIILNILKGEYRYDSEGEKLYFSSERYTKLNYASSGQQESIWILLLIFLIILNNKKVFIVFEEPEAHLYPEAQKELVDLISLISNCNDNQAVITTHSPYILSSFNNLLYAYTIGKIKPKAVESLIRRQLWINPDRINSFFTSNGVLRPIIDQELKLIQIEAIDSASEIINQVYAKLFEMDEN